MRISDWSSDVCSSDLPGPLLGGVRQNDPGVALQSPAQLDQINIGERRRTLRDGLVLSDIPRQPRLGCFPIGFDARPGVVYVEQCPADLEAFRRPRRTRRSEEHTSELQSLMRISYAVFCLKKKNTENNTDKER